MNFKEAHQYFISISIRARKAFMKKILFCILLFTALACNLSLLPVTSTPATSVTEIAPPTEIFGEPDLAAYCQKNGNEYESRSAPGGQYGVCVFPDKSECLDFDYYEGRCKPGDYLTVPTPYFHAPWFEDQKYGFRLEADCGFGGWGNKVIFSCSSEAGNPFTLIVGYGWVDEQIPPLDFNADIRDFQESGTFKLLGQDIPKKILGVNGKVRQVAYGPNLEIGRLRLSMWLADAEGDPLQFEVTPEMQADAEKYISTFSLLNGERPEVKVIP